VLEKGGIKPRGRLVRLGCGGCPPSTCRLSTQWSPAGLPAPCGAGDLILGRASRLDAFSGYPFPTWLPCDAPGGTTGPPAVGPLRSSRTGSGSPQVSMRPRRIQTELSHDVLNPAHVPL